MNKPIDDLNRSPTIPDVVVGEMPTTSVTRI